MISKIAADVVIAGTGIVGCLIAEQVLDAGLSVLMLEAGPRIDRGRITENYRKHLPAVLSELRELSWLPGARLARQLLSKPASQLRARHWRWPQCGRGDPVWYPTPCGGRTGFHAALRRQSHRYRCSEQRAGYPTGRSHDQRPRSARVN